MATGPELMELRDLTAVTITDYDNVALSDIFDSAGSMFAAAASIWRRKAAKLALLVDTSEEGSSRSMSQAYKQAVQQADYYKSLADEEIAAAAALTRRSPRTRAIERA